jgi:hypothetical protein
MKVSRLLPFLLMPMLLGNVQADNSRDKEDLAIVAKSGATHAYSRMNKEDYLTLDNIEELSTHKVSPKITLRYLQKFRVVYNLSTKQVDHLKNAGVNDKVIDYLQATRYMYGEQDRFMNPDYDPFHGYDEDYFRIHHYYPSPDGVKPW